MALTKATHRMISGASANVKDFGAVGDGVTDDGNAIQNALNHLATSTYGGKLFFPAGTYKVTNRDIEVRAPIRLIGEGMASTIIEAHINTTWQAFSVYSSDVGFEHLKIDCQTTSESSKVGIVLQPGTIDNFRMDSVEIEGEDSTKADGTGLIHGIKFNDATNTEGGKVDKCYFHHLSYAFFTANGFGSTGNKAENWTFSNCKMFYTSQTMMTFNSDFDTSGVHYAWDNVKVIGCHFKGAWTGGSGRCIALGTDGCRNLIVTGNTFEDRTRSTQEDAVVHIENYSPGLVVSNNVFRNVFGGIRYYPLNITADTSPETVPMGAVISNNVMQGIFGKEEGSNPSGWTDDSSIGIYIVYDTNGSATNTIISNNVITNFGTGIVGGSLRNDIIVKDNLIKLTYSGIRCNVNTTSLAVEGNKVGNSTNMFYLGANVSSVMGVNNVKDRCTNLANTLSGNTYFSLENLSVIDQFTKVAGTGPDPLFDMPLIANAKVTLRAYEDDNNSNNAIGSGDITAVSSTLTFTQVGRVANGSIALSDPWITNTGGKLNISVYTTVSEVINYTIRFNGTLIWQDIS